MRDDLIARAVIRGFLQVAVAEPGTTEHVDRADVSPIGLAASVVFHQLGLIVLGEHALELDPQLVLGTFAARTLDELHPAAGT
ncbi:hypothetical protein [Streptomyces carpinensis]|uniref:Tetracyclin repressor-like C-terminal domain-containing protein n=1 Tax=Streptomyces carpinensis TaxID=66369 RepID=A0ABV1W3Y7_9ACTN|nr:hypothetical protein [Streptomyces carpinensis]